MKNKATHRHKSIFGVILSMPAALLLLVLLIVPSTLVLALSFTDYQFGMDSFDWVGLRNYAALTDLSGIRNSISNTVIYVLIVTPISIFGALWLAILIEQQGSLGGLFRTVFFLPVTATLVAMAAAWEVVLHPNFGIANVLLDVIGVEKQRFLSDPSLALPTLMGIGLWRNLGYNMLLFLAGLATIDRTLYEAAALDGADAGWRRFTVVTWPMLAPITLFVAVITLIRSFSEFETIAVLTLGGPNGATEMILYTIYQEAFRFFDIGKASALAVVFLATVATISIVKLRFFDRRIHRG